jgi:hypothetical protein
MYHSMSKLQKIITWSVALICAYVLMGQKDNSQFIRSFHTTYLFNASKYIFIINLAIDNWKILYETEDVHQT